MYECFNLIVACCCQSKKTLLASVHMIHHFLLKRQLFKSFPAKITAQLLTVSNKQH